MAQTVKISAFGEVYELQSDRITAVDSQAFRKQVGIPLGAVFTDETTMDLDVIAGLIWLARMQRGEKNLRYVEVAKRMTYDTEVEFVNPEEEQEEQEPGEGDFPEASGVSSEAPNPS